MAQPLLVVARNTSKLNKFSQDSLQGALNLRDFLEQSGEYDGRDHIPAPVGRRSDEGMGRAQRDRVLS